MAHTKSAKKTLRQNVHRRLKNKAALTRLRHTIRKFREAVEAKDVEQAETLMRDATTYLDRASKHNIIHDNQASRRKSRMQKSLNALKTA